MKERIDALIAQYEGLLDEAVEKKSKIRSEHWHENEIWCEIIALYKGFLADLKSIQ